MKKARERTLEDWQEVKAGPVIAFLAKHVLRHPLLLTAVVLMGFGIAATEFLSISLIIPFLGVLQGGDSVGLAGTSKIGFLVPYFVQFDVRTQLQLIALGLVAVQLARGVFAYITGRITAYLKVVVERDMKRAVFEQALDVDYKWVQTTRSAELYTTLRNYPKTAAAMATNFLGGIPNVASGVTYAIVLFGISWQLTSISLTLVLVSSLSINFLVRRLQKKAWDITTARVEQNHVTLETLNGMKQVRLFAQEENAKKRFRDTLFELQDHKYRAGNMQALARPLHSLVNTGLFALVIYLATFYLDTSNPWWIAQLAAFILIMSRLSKPATNLVNKRTEFVSNLPSAQILMEFLDRSDKPFMKDGKTTYTGLKDALRFEDVHFRYAPDQPDVIAGATFEIKRGTTVAIVGGSGAGKSTTINLVARLFDATGGRITVDGVDIRELKAMTWRRRLAVVSQDTFLFNRSARDNIRYARPEATDEEVEEAAKQADAHEFILELDNGYETLLGERGTRLSGGQAQRVAIARAILADPDILILDEATSALDTGTERQVQAAIEKVSQNRTVIAIAHRLSTIKDADNIVVMEHGRVVEQGRHEELLAKKGRYAEYVKMQRLLVEDDQPIATGLVSDIDEAEESPAPVADLLDDEPQLRAVLGANGHATLMRGGDVVTVAPIMRIGPDDDPRTALNQSMGNVVIIETDVDVAIARVGSVIHFDVPVTRARIDTRAQLAEAWRFAYR